MGPRPQQPYQNMQQTVVVQSQPSSDVMVQNKREWSTGIFACCSDVGSLICACFCMHCMMCNLANRMGECCLTAHCVPGGLVAMRAKLRAMTGIKGSIFCDSCAMSCCFACTMCQMDRELKHVGL